MELKIKNYAGFLIFVTFLFYVPFFADGFIIFSDIAVGSNTERYLEEIIGLWNNRFNTTTMLNLPRLFIVLPSYLLSLVFGAQWLTKSFVVLMSLIAGFSSFIFTFNFIKIYLKRNNNKLIYFCSLAAALFYAFNPWFITRIQHTYLLCGYALFPLLVHFYLQIYNKKYAVVKSKKDYLYFAVALSLASAAIHYFFFSVITLGTLILLGLLKKLKQKDGGFLCLLKVESKKTIALASLSCMTCFYWLFPYAAATLTGKMTKQANINVEDTLNMFSRNSSIWEVVTGNSYWWSMFPINQNWLDYNIAWALILTLVFIGVFKFLKNNDVIKLFTFCSIVLVVISTGTYYSFLAPIHEFLVFKVPVIGNLFRDPNKLFGLLMFFYSVFFALGLYFVLSFLKKIIFIGYIGVIVLLGFSVQPYYSNFILNLYKPVILPDSVKSVNEYILQNSMKKTYLPQAEDRVNKKTNVTGLSWNINKLDSQVGKSVGDIYVYGSIADSTFQYEGNSPLVGYYYSYIQSLLDEGRGVEVPSLLKALFSDQIIYQKGFRSYARKEKFNLEVLNIQNNLKLANRSKYANIYNLTGPEEIARVNRTHILTTGGLEKANLFSNAFFSKYLQELPVLYPRQEENNIRDYFNLNLMFDYQKVDELVLSVLDKKYIITPFDYINRAVPYLGWAKTSIYKSEWTWFLHSMAMHNRSFPVERNGGVVATFADARLRAKSYDLIKLPGVLVENLPSLISQGDLFLDNEDKTIKVEVHPVSKLKQPVVSGSLVAGKPTNIWQVAKTKVIKVKGANPYSVKLGISGYNSSSVHIKLHFYNKNLDEIGVAYLSRPDQRDNFNKVKFKTFFITPKDTVSMNIEILSSRRQNDRVLWWVHEFDLFDHEQFREPNLVKIPVSTKKNIRYKVYANIFKSKKGGNINFKISDQSINVNTIDREVSDFKWVDLGEYKFFKDNELVLLENINGFNAVGDIIIVPVSEFAKIKSKLESKLSRSKRLVSFEAELSSAGSKGLQTDRNYPQLSGGKGVTLLRDPIYFNFDLSHMSNFKIFAQGLNIEGNLQYEITNAQGESLYSNSKLHNYDEFIDKVYYVKRLNNILEDNLLQFKNSINFNRIQSEIFSLKPNKYKLKITNVGRVSNLSPINYLKKLYTDINARDYNKEQDQDKKSCCQCGHIDPLIESFTSSVKMFFVETANSCQWHIIQSKVVAVNSDSEYLFKYKFMNNETTKSHQKIIFMDDKNNEIGKHYIWQNVIDNDGEWIEKSELVTPPAQATKMMLLFLFKGNYKKNVSLKVKDLEIIDHTQLPMLDYVLLKNSLPEQIKPLGISKYAKKSLMYKEIILPRAVNGESLTLNQPQHKIWSSKKRAGEDNLFVVNGIFLTKTLDARNTDLVFHIPLGKFYWLGVFINSIMLLLALLSFFIKSRFI